MEQKAPPSVAFGFADIAAKQKPARVRGVFDRVAQRYDAANDAISGGLHRLWKNRMLAALCLPYGAASYTHLDIAGGTGDIARRVETAARARGTNAHIQLIDINAAMLDMARHRLADTPIKLLAGDAEALPIASNSTDGYTIGFGMRNVTHLEKALAEAYRVLKPGGRFVCLEMSNMPNPLLGALYDAYSFHAVPAIGRFVTGDSAPYRYLVESARRFPTAEAFAAQIEAAGFHKVRFARLHGGVAAIHSGWRL